MLQLSLMSTETQVGQDNGFVFTMPSTPLGLVLRVDVSPGEGTWKVREARSARARAARTDTAAAETLTRGVDLTLDYECHIKCDN